MGQDLLYARRLSRSEIVAPKGCVFEDLRYGCDIIEYKLKSKVDMPSNVAVGCFHYYMGLVLYFSDLRDYTLLNEYKKVN